MSNEETLQGAVEGLTGTEEQISTELDTSLGAEFVETEEASEDASLKSEDVANQTKEDPFSSKFAALSRREKEIRKQSALLDARMQELESKLQQLNEVQTPVEQVAPEIPLEYRLRSNPLQTLSEMGLDYDKLTQLALNDGKLTPDMQIELAKSEIEEKYSKKIEELENSLLEDKKSREQEKYNQVEQNFKADLTTFVNENSEYELIRANDAVSLVYEVIQDHYNETLSKFGEQGAEILDLKEASDAVEDYLLEQAKKMMEAKKIRSVLSPEVAQKPVAQPKPTLTNSQTAQAAPRSNVNLSDEESKARAAQLIKWT